MATETGSATDVIDLLDKLRIFCIAQTITVDEFLDQTNRKVLSVNFNGGFYSITFDTGETAIKLTQQTGFVAATAWGSQANSTPIAAGQVTSTNKIDSVVSVPVYHFFFHTTMMYVVFQVSSGIWRAFCFGDITKFGTYTGGSMISGTNTNPEDIPFNTNQVYLGMASQNSGSAMRIRADYTAANQMFSFETNGSGNIGHSNIDGSREQHYFAATPSSTTQATNTLVVRYYLTHETIANNRVPIGELPDMRIMHMKFFNAGDIFDTDWLVFPAALKAEFTDTGFIHSGHIGFAFKFQ